MFETLESRKMFSVTAATIHQTLYVYGDADHNGISVEKSGPDLVVKKYVQGSGYQQIFKASDAAVTAIRVYGYDGNDTISIADAVTDRATVYGGRGADFLKGGGGQAFLWGHGNFVGNPDLDAATDDSAADVTVSGPGYATHYGQKGNDTLLTDENAVSDHDVMFGGPGNDTFRVVGGGSQAYAYGEAGNDALVARQSAVQKVAFQGGAGSDRVDYTAWTEAVYARPDGSAWSGLRFGVRRQVIGADVEIIDGTNKADSFSGTDGNNTFYGRGGNDALNGNGGDDKLMGGDGNDTIFGGGGNDSIAGDKGNDKLFGDDGNDTITGGDGSDDAHGGAGNDRLNGNRDSDWLYGDAGFDTLVGGHGADYLVTHDGTGGNDVAFGDNQDGTDSDGFLDVAYYDKGAQFSDTLVGVESKAS